MSAFRRKEDMRGCIATGLELWFEKPGFPSGPAARAPRSPAEETAPLGECRTHRAGGGSGSGLRCGGRLTSLIRRSNADDAGAQAVDPFGNDDGGHSYVHKQPESPEEEALCKEAKEGCPVEAIGDDGE